MKTRFLTFLFIVPIACSAQHEFINSVNPTTAVVAKIDSLPGVRWIRTGPPLTTLDAINSRYYFVGMTSASIETLYSANVVTGKLRLHGAFPQTIMNMSLATIGNLEFNNATGQLYGVAGYYGQ